MCDTVTPKLAASFDDSQSTVLMGACGGEAPEDFRACQRQWRIKSGGLERAVRTDKAIAK
jgi:hypothetical protein